MAVISATVQEEGEPQIQEAINPDALGIILPDPEKNEACSALICLVAAILLAVHTASFIGASTVEEIRSLNISMAVMFTYIGAGDIFTYLFIQDLMNNNG